MSFFEYLSKRWPDLLDQTLAHAQVVGLAVLIATAVSLVFAALSYRTRWAANLGLGFASVALTIPSLALFALLVPVLDLGYKPTLAGLTIYALLPIARNAIVGLRSVDPAIVEAAAGMGLGRWQRLLRIELPLAWPVILAGIRVATMLTVGIAAVAAIVNGPGLGEPILRGLAHLGGAGAVNEALSGTLAVVVLAILLDLVFVLVRRLTTPRGMRG